MTRTTPARRITLHFEQIFLSDVRTFIAFSSCVSSSLVPVDDPPAAKVIRAQLHEHLVAGEDPDEVLAHLPGDVSQHLVLVLQLDLEHRVRERFDDRRGHFDGVFLRHALSLPSSPSLLRPRPRTSPRRLPGTRGTQGLPVRSSPENNARIRGRPGRPRSPRRCARNAPTPSRPPSSRSTRPRRRARRRSQGSASARSRGSSPPESSPGVRAARSSGPPAFRGGPSRCRAPRTRGRYRTRASRPRPRPPP